MFVEVFKNFEEANNFLKEERYKLYNIIVDTVIDCLLTGEDSKIIAKFVLVDEDFDFNITISRTDWYESLHLALYYFTEIEEYEKCSQIKKLIKKLYE